MFRFCADQIGTRLVSGLFCLEERKAAEVNVPFPAYLLDIPIDPARPPISQNIPLAVG